MGHLRGTGLGGRANRAQRRAALSPPRSLLGAARDIPSPDLLGDGPRLERTPGRAMRGVAVGGLQNGPEAVLAEMEPEAVARRTERNPPMGPTAPFDIVTGA